MKFREYYNLEQSLIRRVEDEKKFSFNKIMMLIKLKALSERVAF